MSYITIGLIIFACLLVLSFVASYYEAKQAGNQVKMWTVITHALNTVPKAIVIGAPMALLVGSILFSISVAHTLHARMETADWIDISESILVTMQVMGTVSVFLVPVFLMMMFDTSALKRVDFVDASANTYSFKQTGLVITSISVLLLLILIGLTFAGQFSSATLVSGSFFTISIAASIAAIIYCYNAKGSTYEEIFAFSMSIIFGVGVYALDLYWNRVLTMDVPLQNLDVTVLTPNEFATLMQKHEMNYFNRSAVTILCILIDLLASALGLITGEIVWLMKFLRYTAYSAVRQGFTTIDQQTRVQPQNRTTPPTPPINTNPPPPPNGTTVI